jgi:hypothetical protein
MIFTNRYFIAVGIPFLLIFLGAIARKLIRAKPWVRDDFYLGVDLSIAAISAGLIYNFELITAKAAASGISSDGCRAIISSADARLLGNAGFLVLALTAFLVVVSMHQDHGGDTGNPRKQWLLLGVVSNVIGAGLMAAFTLIVKGVGT